MLSPGAVLSNRYRLTDRIAAGGMGEVWRGVDLMLQRAVAVKVLLPSLTSDKDFITRFRTEARMMAALRHPGIVQVYDYGEQAPVDYLVMEYIEGTPLSARIAEAGRLGAAETMAMLTQAAEALQAAHEAGIVHRDVKPGNLLIRPGGAIVLVDFGIARSTAVTGITSTNVVLGSVSYMAPEQAEGRPVSPATDVYALGGVAYCCLTGRPPYEGDNPLAVLAQLVHGALPTLPPDVPPAVAAVVLRALAKDPARRFASASALAQAAQAAVRPGAPTQRAGFPPPVTPPQGTAVWGSARPSDTSSRGIRPSDTSSRGIRPSDTSSRGIRPADTSSRAIRPSDTSSRGSVPAAYAAARAGVPRPSAGRGEDTSWGTAVAGPGASVAPTRRGKGRNKTVAVAAGVIALGLAGITAGIIYQSGASEAGTPSDGGAVVTQVPPSEEAAADPTPSKTRKAPTKTRKPPSSKPVEPSPSASETPSDEPDDPETSEPTGDAPGPGEICASAPSDDCD